MHPNANHHDDHARLQRIDHLIESGEPGDDALLNMLRRHVPRPRPESVARLEHELLADPAQSLDGQRPEIARPVIGSPAVQSATPQKRRFPLMAAAAIVIALLGVLIVIGQMSGGATLQTGAQSQVALSPTIVFVATASPVILGPMPSPIPTEPTANPPLVVTATITASNTWTPTASPTITPSATPIGLLAPTIVPTVPPPAGAGDQGIIWPSVRLAPRDDAQPPLQVGSRLAIYAHIQQFASWTDVHPGDVAAVLLTHQARIVNYLDYAGEYVIELPDEVRPVASWLLTNNAYFVYEVIDTP
ncbi:MAG: hypothetical protein KJ065_22550 [Anaerolineae bacterium]|nr:hypothetical protein [Anaerolineae bacterium]